MAGRRTAGPSPSRIFPARTPRTGIPSVKALVRFPEVIKKLNADLNWTISLGDATVNQPQDVANAIQALRAKAMAAGALTTTKQQTVSRQIAERAGVS